MEIRLIFRNHPPCAVGGRSRVGETADGYAVALTIARRLGKSGRHQGKGRNESRGKTRKKSLTPAAKKILVQLYTARVTVPQTDTGRWGENPKALVRTLVQELGKLPP